MKGWIYSKYLIIKWKNIFTVSIFRFERFNLFNSDASNQNRWKAFYEAKQRYFKLTKITLKVLQLIFLRYYVKKKIYIDLSMKYCPSLQSKGLQNCLVSKFEIWKKNLTFCVWGFILLNTFALFKVASLLRWLLRDKITPILLHKMSFQRFWLKPSIFGLIWCIPKQTQKNYNWNNTVHIELNFSQNQVSYTVKP